MLFNLGVAYFAGHEAAIEFLTGYLIEKSLSVDNVFVFLLLFSYFAVPPVYQHKVLFWGVLGALLITEFAWIIYVAGAFLMLVGIKMIVKSQGDLQPENNPLVRW